MIVAEIVLGARDLLTSAVPLTALAAAVVAWSYWRAGSTAWVRVWAAVLKTAGIVALAVCLVEPLRSGVRPRPGSNLFLVVADNSRSLAVHDPGNPQTRGEAMRRELSEKSAWQAHLSQDFEVRSYAFDNRFE